LIDVLWVAFVGAGTICFGAGMLAWMKNPRSMAALIFMLAMAFIFVAGVTGPLYPLIDPHQTGAMDSVAKVFASSILVSETFLWLLAITFPVERKVGFRPLNALGVLFIAAPIAMAAIGAGASVDLSNPDYATLDPLHLKIVVGYSGTVIILTMGLVLSTRTKASEQQWHSASVYLVGLWILAGCGALSSFYAATSSAVAGAGVNFASLALAAGMAVSGLIFAYSIARGQMVMMAPAAEAMTSSKKAQYKLMHRRVYLVEEEKPDFSFTIFADILKGRCFDCENDDSFPCESLTCTSCRLPCPCRECRKYKSRPQGLIVTRQFPNDVRKEHYIQTTPIIWLSSVAGKDNMDPAKMSLLTDFIVNFMERSHNGVVLVDGLEYLATTNDFPRVLKTIDRWAESAMTSSSRLIISVDPRAFEEKEIALLEKNKEVVNPEDHETWRSITEGI
jgi:hypothetical protein